MIKKEVIQPDLSTRRYLRRDANGHFTDDQVSVGKSLAADRRPHAQTVAPKGQGDHGDQKTTKN